MDIAVYENKTRAGAAAAAWGAKQIRSALHERGTASIIVGTGASQFELLAALVREPDIAWQDVAAFHLDEYVGLPATHKASFRKYLRERFESQLPVALKAFYYLDGEADAQQECDRVGQILDQHSIDCAFVGIGENGHLAFNDPPADFETDESFLIVELDEACRRQQLGEGWFETLEEVPKRAITISIRQIMKSRAIACTAPDERKANAVKATVEGPVSPSVPASILQQHNKVNLYLDIASAQQLQT